MSVEFDKKEVILAKLTEQELVDLADFDCGDGNINDFLRDEAFSEQEIGMNTTVLMYYKGRIACFYSICADSIKLTEEEKSDALSYSNIPAIKIARIGRDIRFRNQEFGKLMVKHVIYKALEIDHNYCGVRLITLDAYPHRVRYYETIGFKINEHKTYQGKKRETVSMRYDIYSEVFEKEPTPTGT